MINILKTNIVSNSETLKTRIHLTTISEHHYSRNTSQCSKAGKKIQKMIVVCRYDCQPEKLKIKWKILVSKFSKVASYKIHEPIIKTIHLKQFSISIRIDR